jgi:hypothetical protein
MPIVALGLSLKQQKELKVFLSDMPYHLIYRITEAKLIIFNPDKDDKGVLWEAFRKHYTHVPLLIIKTTSNISEISTPNSHLLEQWNKEALQKVLMTIFSQVSDKVLYEASKRQVLKNKEPCVFFSAYQLLDPRVMYYPAKQSLEHLIGVHQSRNKVGYIYIDGLPRQLVINMQQKKIWYEPYLSEIWHQIVSIDNYTKFSVHAASKTTIQALDNQKIFKTMSLEQFIWLLCVYNSKGRLPEGTDLNCPVRLSIWPNFPRLLPIPHALSLAAFWYRQDLSIQDVLDSKRFPRPSVFAFYSAVFHINLFEFSAHRQPKLQQKTHKHGGLIGRFMAHLSGLKTKKVT